MGDEHETWACELVCPHAHAFIQAIHVTWYEVVLHVCPHASSICCTSQNLSMKVGEGMLVKVRAERMSSSSSHSNAQMKRGPMKHVDWVGHPELSPLGSDDSPH